MGTFGIGETQHAKAKRIGPTEGAQSFGFTISPETIAAFNKAINEKFGPAPAEAKLPAPNVLADLAKTLSDVAGQILKDSHPQSIANATGRPQRDGIHVYMPRSPAQQREADTFEADMKQAQTEANRTGKPVKVRPDLIVSPEGDRGFYIDDAVASWLKAL